MNRIKILCMEIPKDPIKHFKKVNVSQCDAVRRYSISWKQLKMWSSLSTGKRPI